MLTQEPGSWQGPGLQRLPEKILALKSGSLVVPTWAPHGMSKQTGPPDHGVQGMGRLRLQAQGWIWPWDVSGPDTCRDLDFPTWLG